MNYHQVVYLYTCIMSFPKRERKHGTVPNASVVRHCRGRFRGCFTSSSQPALIPIALLSFPWRAGGGPNFLQPSPRRCPPCYKTRRQRLDLLPLTPLMISTRTQVDKIKCRWSFFLFLVSIIYNKSLPHIYTPTYD